MNINLTCVMLVLDSTPNPDIRKNDIKTIKILMRHVDKSNFHKRITKYCTEIPDKTTHRGHRPGKIYKFKAQTGDAWL